MAGWGFSPSTILLIPSPLHRIRHVDRRQTAKGRCGGTEAIQYSNTGAAAPVISINYSTYLRLEDSKMDCIFLLVGSRDGPGLLQGHDDIKQKVESACKPAPNRSHYNAQNNPWRARHHGRPRCWRRPYRRRRQWGLPCSYIVDILAACTRVCDETAQREAKAKDLHEQRSDRIVKRFDSLHLDK